MIPIPSNEYTENPIELVNELKFMNPNPSFPSWLPSFCSYLIPAMMQAVKVKTIIAFAHK